MFNTFPRPVPDSGGGLIKSIQRGETSNNSAVLSFTATISPVDPARSIVIAKISGGTGTNPSGMFVRATITDPTTITFTKGAAASGNPTVAWEVIEFSSLKSLQSGTTTVLSANTTGTATIAPVNPNKTLTFCTRSSNSITNTLPAALGDCTLTDSTTLLFRHSGGGDSIFAWYVVELN